MLAGALGWILNRKGLAMAALVGLSLASGVGLTKLRFDDDLDSIFRGASTEQELLDELATQIPFERSEFLLLTEAPDLITPGTREALEHLISDLQDLGQVERVRSVLQFQDEDLASLPPASEEDVYRRIRKELSETPRTG